MKYQLHVSYNCGINYSVAQEADNLAELGEKAEEFERQGLRWSIENEAGEPVEMCDIHMGIFEFMAKINASKEEHPK